MCPSRLKSIHKILSINGFLRCRLCPFFDSLLLEPGPIADIFVTPRIGHVND